MTKIRDDLDGVVYAPGPHGIERLSAGQDVPDGVLVGPHLLSDSTTKAEPKPSGGEPRGNASRDEWAAYAATIGIEAPEGAKRDDIKALIEAGKTPATPVDEGGDTPPQE